MAKHSQIHAHTHTHTCTRACARASERKAIFHPRLRFLLLKSLLILLPECPGVHPISILTGEKEKMIRNRKWQKSQGNSHSCLQLWMPTTISFTVFPSSPGLLLKKNTHCSPLAGTEESWPSRSIPKALWDAGLLPGRDGGRGDAQRRLPPPPFFSSVFRRRKGVREEFSDNWAKHKGSHNVAAATRRWDEEWCILRWPLLCPAHQQSSQHPDHPSLATASLRSRALCAALCRIRERESPRADAPLTLAFVELVVFTAPGGSGFVSELQPGVNGVLGPWGESFVKAAGSFWLRLGAQPYPVRKI